MKRSWHGWRRAAAGIVGSLVVLLATAAPATEVVAERRPNPAGPHGRNRRPGRAERGRRRRCHQADRLRERRFPPDLRLPAADRRRAARHLAGERGEVRARYSRRPDRPQRPAESHLGRPAGGALEGFRRMGPADLSHAHGRRRAERRAGHHRAHAAIRPGRGRAADVGHADRHEHALRRECSTRSSCTRSIPRTSSTARRSCVSISSASATAWPWRRCRRSSRISRTTRRSPRSFSPRCKSCGSCTRSRCSMSWGCGGTSGQHALVQKILKKFPTEDVTGEILQTVRQVQAAIQGVRGEAEGHRRRLARPCCRRSQAACRPRGPGDGAGRDGAGAEPRNAAPHGGLPAEPERPEAQGRGEALAGRQRLVAGVRRGLDRFAGDPLGMAAAGPGAEVLDRDDEGASAIGSCNRSSPKPPPSRRCWPRWPPT